MNAQFIRERISQLCLEHGISEYCLSLELGLNKSYNNKITRGKALPSMSVFLEICDYFQITPKDFFNTELSTPCHIASLLHIASTLTSDQIKILEVLAEQMKK